MAFLGLVVLAGVLLAYLVQPWWIALTIFAGLNAIQVAFTGVCPAAVLFKRLGLRPGPVFK
jgi:hypothetical protein